MKTSSRIACLLLVCSVLYGSAHAQNTFPWPSTGSVGIGTTAPASLLDIKSGTTFTQSLLSAQAFQVRSSSNTSSGFWQGSSFYGEQTGPNAGNFSAIAATAVTSHTSGNVALALPFTVGHMHTGAGTIGETHLVDSRLVITANAGNITNAILLYGSMSVLNGLPPTNVVQNGFGLYIASFPSNVTNKFGIYINDVTANNYFGGSVSIGTTSAVGYKLAVNGSAIFTKAVVKLFGSWPDYVFKKDYELPSLKSVEEYVKANSHLPGMPSVAEVEKNGIDLGNNQAALLKKVEELTLYTIQLQKEVEALQTALQTSKK